MPARPLRIRVLSAIAASRRGTEREGSVGVATRARTKTKSKLERPKLFKVLLHNDDFTTREFVVWILMEVFNRPESEAVRVMLHVHNNGVGVAGVYSHEVAETKVEMVAALARANEHPLLCTLEPE